MKTDEELFNEYLNELNKNTIASGTTSKSEFAKMMAFYNVMQRYETDMLIHEVKRKGVSS